MARANISPGDIRLLGLARTRLAMRHLLAIDCREDSWTSATVTRTIHLKRYFHCVEVAKTDVFQEKEEGGLVGKKEHTTIVAGPASNDQTLAEGLQVDTKVIIVSRSHKIHKDRIGKPKSKCFFPTHTQEWELEEL